MRYQHLLTLSLFTFLAYASTPSLHAAVVLGGPGDFQPGVSVIDIGNLTESTVGILTVNSVIPVDRNRYGNAALEVRSLNEPVPGDSFYGLLYRQSSAITPGTFTLVSGAAVPSFGPDFGRLGMEIFFATPVAEFGFTSVASGTEPRIARFFDASGGLIDTIDASNTTTSATLTFVGLSSPSQPIARIEFEEDDGSDGRQFDGVGTPAVTGSFYLTPVPEPTTAALTLLGLTCLSSRYLRSLRPSPA